MLHCIRGIVAILAVSSFFTQTVSAGNNCYRRTTTTTCRPAQPSCSEKIACLQKQICCLNAKLTALTARVGKNEVDIEEERKLRKEQAIAIIHLREAITEFKDEQKDRDAEHARRINALQSELSRKVDRESFAVIKTLLEQNGTLIGKLKPSVTVHPTPAAPARDDAAVIDLQKRLAAAEAEIARLNKPSPPMPTEPVVSNTTLVEWSEVVTVFRTHGIDLTAVHAAAQKVYCDAGICSQLPWPTVTRVELQKCIPMLKAGVRVSIVDKSVSLRDHAKMIGAYATKSTLDCCDDGPKEVTIVISSATSPLSLREFAVAKAGGARFTLPLELKCGLRAHKRFNQLWISRSK